MIPADIWEQYAAVLKKRAVPVSHQADYRKWLRYYLDFRSKYPLPDSRSEKVRLFIQKLREKRQTLEQQKQAAHALSLFFESQPRTNHFFKSQAVATLRSSSQPLDSGDVGQAPVLPPSAGKRFNEWRCLEKSGSPAWDKMIDNLAAEIKIRHYSRKTLKAYADWSRKFQNYLRNKPPDELSATDVKSYLTYLPEVRLIFEISCTTPARVEKRATTAEHCAWPMRFSVLAVRGVIRICLHSAACVGFVVVASTHKLYACVTPSSPPWYPIECYLHFKLIDKMLPVPSDKMRRIGYIRLGSSDHKCISKACFLGHNFKEPPCT